MHALKSYISFDTMLAAIPSLLIIFTIFYFYMFFLTIHSNLNLQDTKYKLFLVSEYIVKNRAHKIEGVNYINWIDEKSLNIDKNYIKKKLKLKNLYIGFHPEGDICIYRIIVYGDEKDIKKLYVCS